MKKRALATAIASAFALLFTATPNASYAATGSTFKDIQNHWAKNDIEFLVSKNLLNGYEDGTFKPDKPITRAEASAVIVNELKIPISNMTGIVFPDIPNNYWAWADIYTAASIGFIGGYTDGTFRPNKPLTRAELSSILVRAYDLKEKGTADTNTFKDVEKNQWFYNSVNILNENDLVSGFSDETFRPNSYITRAEFSAFVARMIRQYTANPVKYYTFKHTKTAPNIDSYINQIWVNLEFTFNKSTIDLEYSHLTDAGVSMSKDEYIQALKEAYYTGDTVYVNNVVFYYDHKPHLDWKESMLIMW
jgi:hypothetical protein